MRVEPKVFFANERTFLSWLNFTVVLGGLAMGLLNFGDRVGRLSAVLFTFIAMGVMLYALYTFHWRATKIRNREAAPYDDRVGPTVLCIFLLAAVVTNFYCKLKTTTKKKLHHASGFSSRYCQCASMIKTNSSITTKDIYITRIPLFPVLHISSFLNIKIGTISDWR